MIVKDRIEMWASAFKLIGFYRTWRAVEELAHECEGHDNLFGDNQEKRLRHDRD